eukprot:4631691-Karenia_brevis.AAC.1
MDLEDKITGLQNQINTLNRQMSETSHVIFALQQKQAQWEELQTTYNRHLHSAFERIALLESKQAVEAAKVKAVEAT